jgi:hypothetical protein
MTHTMAVLRARHLPPSLLIECAGECTHTFRIVDGCAFPVLLPGAERPTMGFFCSPYCYLSLVHPENCSGTA